MCLFISLDDICTDFNVGGCSVIVGERLLDILFTELHLER